MGQLFLINYNIMQDNSWKGVLPWHPYRALGAMYAKFKLKQVIKNIETYKLFYGPDKYRHTHETIVRSKQLLFYSDLAILAEATYMLRQYKIEKFNDPDLSDKAIWKNLNYSELSYINRKGARDPLYYIEIFTRKYDWGYAKWQITGLVEKVDKGFIGAYIRGQDEESSQMILAIVSLTIDVAYALIYYSHKELDGTTVLLHGEYN